MKKILITGASGFIGSFLVETALSRHYEVYAALRKTSNTSYLEDPRITYIELDFSDTYELSRKILKAPYFDYVIHNAGVTRAFYKKDYLTSNYEYTKNLIDAFISLKKVPEKFIYMSSLAAYGPGDPLKLMPVKSSDIPRPVTSYGRSKLASEKYLKSLRNFPYLIIRPTAVYGPREKDLLTVFKLINKNLEIFVGLKKQYLSFIYVKDLAEAVFLALESNIINRDYFVSDGNVYDGNMLGNIIRDQLHKKTIRIYVPKIFARVIAMIIESTKYFNRKQPLLNLEKIKELECINWKCDINPLVSDLHFKPKYDLNKGIVETTTWYKKAKWIK